MRFAEPGWLLLLILVPLPLIWEWLRPRMAWSSLEGFAKAPRGWAVWVRHGPVLLRMLAIAALAVAMARPQEVAGRTRIAGRGVAIVVALDNSSSMNAVDFTEGGQPISRLDAARQTLERFVVGRPDDLIGLVVFANYPDVACPPTLDHAFLLETVRQVRSARAGDDGTNIGDAIAWSLEALRRTTPTKKVLVLLSDGHNEPAVPQPLDPEAAAELARELGVTLHTIAIGQEGGIVREPEVLTGLPFVAEVGGPDLELLERLAARGGGRTFQATDAESLAEVFDILDELETSPVQAIIRTRYRERYGPWVAAALAALALDRLVSGGRLRRLP